MTTKNQICSPDNIRFKSNSACTNCRAWPEEKDGLCEQCYSEAMEDMPIQPPPTDKELEEMAEYYGEHDPEPPEEETPFIVAASKLGGVGCLFYVGGFVRDLLMGVKSKDVDLASPCPPDVIIKALGGALVGGASAMPVVLTWVGGIQVEIASFRTEVAQGRNKVEWKHTHSMEKDAYRRDFTVNAIYQDCLTGEIHYPIPESKEDIEKSILRFIGNGYHRVKEDPVRLLRAVRFIGRGFTPSFLTWDLMRFEVAHNLLDSLPKERITMELIKCFKENPHSTYEVLLNSGLMRKLFPTVAKVSTVDQKHPMHLERTVGNHLNEGFFHLQQFFPEEPILALAWLYHDTGKVFFREKEDGSRTFHGHEEDSTRIASVELGELCLAGADMETILWLIENHMRAHRVLEMKPGKRKALVTHKDWPLLVKLAEIDNCACSPEQDGYKALQAIVVEDEPASIKELGITGKTVMENFNLAPGRLIGQVLGVMQGRYDEQPTLTAEQLLAYGLLFLGDPRDHH
jgi:tRNA nucleotidyltransferase (CCA-adding enzyme)